ncbi:MAG: alkaline phosphatase family protein [Anaerolineae bacterium]|uniref:alkaline phosphatase family protein n=1 Tax=Candidatus Amarolinea dominans TaxID=3140696 RepID=UPI003136B667|nr:alkaline phosphatase family protein [Anaerolineae bacterium]
MTAGSSFIKPQYGGRCFADLPSTIQYLLTGAGRAALAPEIMAGLADRYDTIIFMFIDSFGWRFFEQAAPDYPALQRFVQHGRAERITAQFPSTTAAHVTTIHSGLPVAASGVYEWFYYTREEMEIPLLMIEI